MSDVPSVLLGIAGPLAAVTVRWLSISQAARAGRPLTSVILKGFLLKALFFATYVVVMLRVFHVAPMPFVISFTSAFVAFYGFEAWLLSGATR